ncbi:MAG: phage head closure protein [Roseiflexus sp.]|jgi:SPP1 family predicted phage head-tail adaptor|nr:phage head closure protein [Roseiflexus sp.]
MRRRITAGDLRERVTIQRATVERDAFGGEVLNWADGETVWANVFDRSGRESIIADRPVMLVGYEVTIRSGVVVTHQDRLKWRGKLLHIEAVTPKPAEDLIVMRCLEAEYQG